MPDNDRRGALRRNSDADMAVLSEQMSAVRSFVESTKTAMVGINASLSKLTELSVKQDSMAEAVERAFKAMGEQGGRLRATEDFIAELKGADLRSKTNQHGERITVLEHWKYYSAGVAAAVGAIITTIVEFWKH